MFTSFVGERTCPRHRRHHKPERDTESYLSQESERLQRENDFIEILSIAENDINLQADTDLLGRRSAYEADKLRLDELQLAFDAETEFIETAMIRQFNEILIPELRTIIGGRHRTVILPLNLRTSLGLEFRGKDVTENVIEEMLKNSEVQNIFVSAYSDKLQNAVRKRVLSVTPTR